jgi:hypothetical protein
MHFELPPDPKKIGGRNMDKEIIRMCMMAEQEAINDYEKAAGYVSDPHARDQILSVAREEKVHFAEFYYQLSRLDDQMCDAMDEGKNEVLPTPYTAKKVSNQPEV